MTDDQMPSRETPDSASPPVGPPPAWSPGPLPPPTPAGPKRHTGIILGVVVAVLLVVAGGITVVLVSNHRADVAAQERKEERERKVEAERLAQEEADREREAQEAAALAEAVDRFDTCSSELDELVTSLSDIDSRLSVGLTQKDLAAALGDASIAYDGMDIDVVATDTQCLAAAIKLEKAFNTYNKSVKRWSDCIFDLYCEYDSIEPSMQRNWKSASRLVEQAEDEMDQLDPTSASYAPDAGEPGDAT